MGISSISHGLRRGSCEIVDVDELDDLDDLPHPDTMFSQLWKDETSQKSCKTSGESLSVAATKAMSEIATQGGQRELSHKSAPEVRHRKSGRFIHNTWVPGPRLRRLLVPEVDSGKSGESIIWLHEANMEED